MPLLQNKVLSSKETLNLLARYGEASIADRARMVAGITFTVNDDIVLAPETMAIPPNMAFSGGLDGKNTRLPIFDSPVKGCLDLRGVRTLVELGPHLSERVIWSYAGTPVHGIAKNMMTVLNDPRRVANNLVAVTPEATCWKRDPSVPALTPRIGRALRMAAACYGPFIVGGNLSCSKGDTAFSIDGVYYSNGGTCRDEGSHSRMVEDIRAYYEASVVECSEPVRIILPALRHPPTVADGNAVAHAGGGV